VDLRDALTPLAASTMDGDTTALTPGEPSCRRWRAVTQQANRQRWLVRTVETHRLNVRRNQIGGQAELVIRHRPHLPRRGATTSPHKPKTALADALLAPAFSRIGRHATSWLVYVPELTLT
jgi:hypothetical protein